MLRKHQVVSRTCDKPSKVSAVVIAMDQKSPLFGLLGIV